MSLVNYEDIYEEFLSLSSSPPERSSTFGNKNKTSNLKAKSLQIVIPKTLSVSPVSIQIISPKISSASSNSSLENSPTSINFSILKMGSEDASTSENTTAPILGDKVDGSVGEPLQNSSVICARLDDRQQYGEKRSDPSSSNTSVSQQSNNGPPPSKRVALLPSIGLPSISNSNYHSLNQNSLTEGAMEAQFHPRASNSNGGYNALDGQQQGNRQQNPYYPYTADFQYPSPHFLTGGCLQPTPLIPSHMHHHTGWNLGHGQNHQMGDHNYLGVASQSQPQQNNQNNLSQQQYSGIGSQQFQLPPYQNQNTSNTSQLLGSNNQMTSIPNQMVSNHRSSWSLNTESIYPGGLEVLWREVPEECQKLMTIQDVPDTARFRGYFTVCELITLKRSLMSRLTCNNNKGAEINSSNEVGVGMAVKEAMNALHDDSQNSDNNNVKSEYCNLNGPLKTPTTAIDTSISSGTGSSATVVTAGNSGSNQQCGLANNNMGPPPPYRTATLVFKLLQIGNYQFRSFSEVNPNRLRVLFNTQRLTYECQLSVVRPPRDGMQPLRKLLTVDIGFDQISVIRFGPDKLFLKVEGAPLLTVTYNPANEDSTCPPLSQQDHQLLEQIDKGQLKLSPCHQLYFLNERLVHLLEAQFREHPRFRHIVQNTFHHQHQSQLSQLHQSSMNTDIVLKN